MALHLSSGNRRSRRASTAVSPTSGGLEGTTTFEEGEEVASAILPAAREREATAFAQGTFGNTLVQSALGGGASAAMGLDQLVAGEMTLAAGGVGGQVEVLSSNNAMLRAMRDSIDLDVSGVRAMNSVSESGGMALAPEQLERYELAFGRDLGHVRIHADGRAADAAQAIQAYAFALGAHIFFGSGIFSPGTRAGDRVLAHELTHVVQADQGRLPSSSSGGDGGQQVSSPSDPHEVEAYASENRMLDRLQQVDRQIERASAEADRGAPASDVGMSGIAVDGSSAGTATASSEVTSLAGESSLDGAGVMDGGLDLGVASFGAAVTSPGESGQGLDASAPMEGAETAMRDASGEALDTDAATSFIKNSRGAALPSAVVQKMSGLLGHDFSHVRVHTDSQAAKASEALGARAFALGADVFFGAGEFAPESRDGDRLLAHELTHVVQSDEGRLQASGSELDVSSPSDSTEREAEAAESIVDSSPAMMSDSSAPMSEMAAPAAAMDAGDMSGVAHREASSAESAPSTGVAEEYVFHIGGLEHKARPPGTARAGADVVFNLGWNVVPGLTLGRAVVHLDNEGKIERGTVTGTFEAGNYITGGELQLVIGAEGAIDAHVHGNYDLGWLAGEFQGVVERTGMSATIDLATTRPLVDGEGRFVVGSITGAVSMSTDGHWSGEGEISGSWEGVGTATIRIVADNDHLAGEVDLTLEQFSIGENATVGPSEIHGTYDSVEGIVLNGRILVTVGDFEAELVGTLELDALGGIVGASGEASSSGAAAAPAASEGAPAPAPAPAPAAAAGQGAPAGDAGGGAPATAPAGGGRESGPAAGGRGAAPAPAGEAAGPATGGPASPAGASPGGASGGGGRRGRRDAGGSGPGVAPPAGGAVAQGPQTSPPVPTSSILPGGGVLALPQGATLGGRGVLRQKADIEVDGFVLSNGELSIGMEENAFTDVGTRFDFTFDRYHGTIDATIDVASGLLNGTGTAEITEEMPIGETGAIVKSASGSITVEENIPTTLKGAFNIEIPFEEQPTFEVTSDDLTFNIPEAKGSGSVTATLLRQLTFGDLNSMHAIIVESASATATITDNTLERIDGGMPFTVTEPSGDVGDGTIKFEMTPEGSVNATAEFTLTEFYGLPERGEGPLFLKDGGKFTLTVTEGALAEGTLEDVGFQFENATGEGSVEGTLAGEIAFDTMLVQAAGEAHIVEPWVILGEGWGAITFKEGGSIIGEVKDSELETLTGDFPYESIILGGARVFELEGMLSGRYEKETESFSGHLDGTLNEEVEFELPDGAGRLVLLAGATAAIEMEDSDFTEITLGFDVEYYRAEDSEAFLGGHIGEATYNIADDTISFDGAVTLLQDIEKSTKDGKWTVRALKDSEVTVNVEANALTKIGGNVGFEIDDDEDTFLEGDLKELEFEIATSEFSGELDVRTAREFDFPHKKDEGDVPATGYRLVVDAGSEVRGRIEKNDLASVGATLKLGVDFLTVERAVEGELGGDYNFTDDSFTGAAALEVKKPFPIAGGERETEGTQLESFIVGVLPGSGLWVDIADNQLQRAHVEIEAVLDQNGNDVAFAHLSGDYKLGDEEEGFSGNASAEVEERIDWAEGTGDYHYYIDSGTKFDAAMTQSAIDSAGGTFILIGKDKTTQKDTWSIDAGGTWDKETGVTGGGKITVLEDIALGEGATFKAFLEKDSEADASVEADEFKELHGLVNIRLDEGDTAKLSAKFDVNYTAGEAQAVSGTGEITVLDDFEIGGIGLFTFTLMKDSCANGSVTENELDWIDGDVQIRVSYDGAEIGIASLNGKYTHGDSPDFTGQGDFEVTAAYIDLGIDIGGITGGLVAGAGIHAEVEANELTILSGHVPLLLKHPEYGDFLAVDLSGTYDHRAKTFDGRATGELIPRVRVGELDGYEFFVDPATGIWADFTQDGLQQIGGQINASVEDDGGLFLEMHGDATFTPGQNGAEGMLSAHADVTVKHDKSLLGGAKSEWSVLLCENSGGEVDIVDNELMRIGGTIDIRVDRGGDPFASIELNGAWVKDEGFTGDGEAHLVVPRFEMATVGEYTFTLLEGSGGEIHVERDEVKTIHGIIRVGIDKGTESFMEGEVDGTYLFTEEEFTGSGSIEVVNPQQLASVGTAETLWLIEGSGVEVNITKNDLDRVGGNLTLSLRDGGGEYLTCSLEGNYDIKGGTGFTGDGDIDVTRRKLLFGTDGSGYSFWLDIGAGAHADILENDITRVSGNIPFVVKDELGDLLIGHAEGEYIAETGNVTANGEVHLGRDLDIVVGDLTIKFLKDSGGHGDVVDSELHQLGGHLMAELWKDGKGIVHVEADGEYDAVNKNIVRLSGSATLMQPIELLEGQVVISDVSGDATIENNQLVEAGGRGTVTLPKLGNGNAVTGTFDLRWSNRTGVDVYEGSGEIEFALFNDPAHGRGMNGTVAATYRSDNTFEVDGDVHYQMNEMIGGDVHVHMTEAMDPVIDADMNAKGTLVPGRDLFRMEQDIIPRTTTPIYGPIALIYGVKGGLALGMQPLTFDTTIGIMGWHPKEGNVPTFFADLDMNWGFNFEAMLAAYMSLSLSVGVADIGAGIRGTLSLNAPLNISPHAHIEGGPGGFGGELGIGISLAPTMSLSIVPYVEAAIIGLDPFQHDFSGIDIDFGELFKFEWGATYQFGDTPARADRAPEPQPVAAPAADTSTPVTAPPSFGGNSAGAAGNSPGGPQLESGSEVAGNQEFANAQGGGGGQMDEMMEYIGKIEKISKGLGAMGYLMGLLSGVLTALSFGPIGLGLYLIYLYIFEDFSFERVGEAIDDLMTAVGLIADILKPYLPGWLNDLIGVIRNPPSLYDMLFGADDAARASVRSGEIFQAKGESRGPLHARAVADMISGWTGEDDQECILILLQRGDLNAIVAHNGTEDILDDLDGYEDDQARLIFRQNGIAY